MTDRVYIANFGEGNALWPIAKANNTIITVDNVNLHPFWKAGDRDGFIETAITSAWTARGKRPRRELAGRWYNLNCELRDTEDDIWISRQGSAVWWTISQPGELREEFGPSTNPDRDGPTIWRLEKPCLPWSDRDRQGRPLLWAALHPKAREFLATEATLQSSANDRGYADYARALVNGDSLEPWHRLPLFKAKVASTRKDVGRTFTPKEKTAERLAYSIVQTVSQSNGGTIERTIKDKQTPLTHTELVSLMLDLIERQDSRCALTGLPLGLVGECEDREMMASPDRIDSNGHYTADNIQVVCWFINRWKSADDNALTLRLIEAVKAAD